MYTYMQGFETLLKHTNEKQIFESKIGAYIRRYNAHSLLDIGAGDGSLAPLLARKVSKYVAIESKEKYIANLRAAGLEAVQADFPAPVDGRYDLVLMSHVISYNRGNQEALISAAWKSVAPGGHLLVVTHGNSQEDDWEKLLRYIGFGEAEKFAITFADIVAAMEEYGHTEIEKVETTIETENVTDLLEALNFIASGSNTARSERFMNKSDSIERYLTDNYFNGSTFAFPFQHLFVSIQKKAA